MAARAPKNNAVIRLLDETAARLRAGRLAGLGPLAADLDRAIDMLLKTGASADALREIQSHAARNHLLIAGARAGIEAAQERVGTIRRAARGMSVYTAEGRTMRIMSGTGSIVKRA